MTCHDGFTLADLVSYNEKHNDANGEHNRYGENYNRSWNCGVEGPTEDAEVLALRHRQIRNILTTLMVSQGTTMISHGDEVGRTQDGNNNGYCQDNELTWIDWSNTDEYADILDFARRVTALRAKHPVFRRRRFFEGRHIKSADRNRDIAWFNRDGVQMTPDDWQSGIKSVAVFLNGDTIPEPDARGERVVDDSFLLCFNAHAYPVEFLTPDGKYARQWTVEIDTFDPSDGPGRVVTAGTTVSIPDRSILVFRKTY